MFESLDISRNRLLAQRTRMDTIAANIANMNTTRNARGEPIPYRRRFAVFASAGPMPPKSRREHFQNRHRPESFRKEYQPNHPDHDKDGYVSYPNIDLAVEYVNALEASRAYEANVTAMEVSKAMLNASLRLLA